MVLESKHPLPLLFILSIPMPSPTASLWHLPLAGFPPWTLDSLSPLRLKTTLVADSELNRGLSEAGVVTTG